MNRGAGVSAIVIVLLPAVHEQYGACLCFTFIMYGASGGIDVTICICCGLWCAVYVMCGDML
jgi:hypothetical protein